MDKSLRSNGSMSRRNVKGLVSARKCLLRLDQAKSRGLRAWLGVWERNFKAQIFTTAFDLNDLVNTSISPEIPWIQTGCCASI